jgi:tetratricopeptide (TPR) repeat protein
MPQVDADFNLLFGVVALQIDAISRSQFVDACTLWATQKQRALADLLAERGWLSADDRAEVQRLVERKLKRHGGDARAGLADLTGEAVQQSLAAVADPEARRSLGLPQSAATHVIVSTIGYLPGSRDRYTLTRLHAQGGVGRVWLARDQSLGRDVALKELRPETSDHPAIWARFLEEARITGQLEHPNIVPVHELAGPAKGDGESAERPPFYTMRFVKGRTLSEASRAYHARRAEGQAGALEMRELLQAFVGVCQALAYAHSRGVIHRDLKGQNVVLGDFGEVIVLDWGLAKVVGQAEETLTPPLEVDHAAGRGETMQGHAMGTPAYMSPEQAEGRWELVDRRTDVYGLGAILYEILCGRPPFDGANTAEVLRLVAQEPPVRPRIVCDATPAALEAVCVKALEKKPADRYPTALALAADVKRWMADEPVSTYREPFAIRAGRWARQHRPLVASAAAVLMAAVVGLSAGTVLLSQANGRTEAQRRRAEALRLTAQANFQKARQAVDEYFTKVSESKLLNVPGLQPLRKELLESSRKYYEEFLKNHADDPSVRAEAAEAWYRVGFVTMDINPGKEALDAFANAVAMYDQLVRDHPSTERYTYKLAMCLNDLGNQQSALGLEADSRGSHERCLAIRQQVVRDHPNVPEYVKELGIGYGVWSERQISAGLPSEALRSNEQERDIFERLVREHPGVADYRWRLAGALGSIGRRQTELGEPAEAMRMYEQSLVLTERLTREHPDVVDYQYSLLNIHAAIGWMHYRLLGQNKQALDSYAKALELAEKTARENPGLESSRSYVAAMNHELGRVLVRLGMPDDALARYRAALDDREARERREPGGVWAQRELGYLYYEIGKIHQGAGRPAKASPVLVQALAIFEEISESKALDPYNRACAKALCAGLVGAAEADVSKDGNARRRKFAEQAVANLREAVTGGYRSAGMIASDVDFEAVRPNADFQALVAELKSRAQAQTAPTPPDTLKAVTASPGEECNCR